MTKRGKFIVIEGSDGSGKGTHFKLVHDWLSKRGYAVETFDFPQYGQPSAYFVEQYLNGEYGDISDIGPYKGSLFYALDRYAASFKIRDALATGKHVVSNRYVGSNMGHQGGKIPDKAKRLEYFKWNAHLEYEILGIPRPDLNIVLHMPSQIAQQLVDRKGSREYLKNGKTRDIHENDIEFLKRSEQTYAEMCELLPRQFTKISSMENDQLLPIGEISKKVIKLVENLITREQGAGV